MIYLIGGENEFACRQKLDEILDQHKLNADIIVIDSDEINDFNELANKLQSSSLFSEETIIVIKYFDKNKVLQGSIEKIIKTVPASSRVIFYLPNVKTAASWYKKIENVAQEKLISVNLDESNLVKWVLNEVALRGGQISTSDASFLIEWVGDEQFLLFNEIKKMLSCALIIDQSSIRQLTIRSPRTTVFQLLDAMVRGETEKAQSYFQDLRSQQFEEGYIMGMICWQMHALASVFAAKDSSSKEINGVSPFVVRKLLPIAKSMTKTKIVEILNMTAEVDRRTKAENIDKAQLIEQLIRKVAHLQC